MNALLIVGLPVVSFVWGLWHLRGRRRAAGLRLPTLSVVSHEPLAARRPVRRDRYAGMP